MIRLFLYTLIKKKKNISCSLWLETPTFLRGIIEISEQKVIICSTSKPLFNFLITYIVVIQ